MDLASVQISREQLKRATAVIDAARFLLAADTGALERVVGRNVVRNLRGALAKLDNWEFERRAQE